MITRDIICFLNNRGISYQAEGDESQIIEGYSSIYNYRASTITWIRKISTIQEEGFLMPECFSLIVTKFETPRIENAVCQIWVDNPKDTFFDILDEFWGEKNEAVISPSASIESGAVIGENTSIGPFTYISKDTVIGNNCRIGANVTLKGKVTVGDNCVIQSGAVIGEDGFAFIKEAGTQKFVKHYGGVKIEDNVSIGSQTCVCRGAIDDTWIKEYAKIDNLCHIAHNAVIGKCSIIVAGTIVMGSVHIGNDCWVASSMIRDQRHVGNQVVVGMGAVVVKDVPDGQTVAGNPAKPFERKEKI